MTIYARLPVLIVSFALALVLPVSALAAGPAPINLLSAHLFTVLSGTGITNTGSHSSNIIGNIGSSPISAAAMTTVFCSELFGTMYGVDSAYVGSGDQTCFAGNPPLLNKTLVDNAVLDMGVAYADAAGRTLPTATELGAGDIGGMTLAPGLYKWSTDLDIPTSVTLSGGPNDVWIFQIAGDLTVASSGSVPSGVKVILSGGAQASNIFWQVGGVTGATIGTYATFNGTILAAKQIILQTGTVMNGRALAQTQVTLDATILSGGSTVSGTLIGITGGGSIVGGSLGGNIDGGSIVSGAIGGSTGGSSSVSGSIGGGIGGSTTSGSVGGSTGGSTGSLSGNVGGTGGGGGGGGGGGAPSINGSNGGTGTGQDLGEVLGASTDDPNFVGIPNTGEGGSAVANWIYILLATLIAGMGAFFISRRLTRYSY